MGVIENVSSGARVTLRSQHLVGRSRVCQLRLKEPEVSGTHAMLAWHEERWTVRDLGSTNGSWVGSARLSNGDTAVLKAGAVVSFGTADNRWRLLSAAPPSPMALELDTNREVAGEAQILGLPDPESPLAVVVLGTEGEWRLEHGGEIRFVRDLDIVEVEGSRYTLHLPDEIEGTAVPHHRRSLASLRLLFKVSAHEETIELQATGAGATIDLGGYSHNQVLLHLARQRLADRDNGITDPDEEGWCYPDDVTQALRLKSSGLNVAIHRARRHFARVGIDGAADIIVRRSGTRQVRLGTDCFEIG
jgi:pSer/pThr/pTyr-binding forkhead associated (FHA) protein